MIPRRSRLLIYDAAQAVIFVAVFLWVMTHGF